MLIFLIYIASLSSLKDLFPSFLTGNVLLHSQSDKLPHPPPPPFNTVFKDSLYRQFMSIIISLFGRLEQECQANQWVYFCIHGSNIMYKYDRNVSFHQKPEYFWCKQLLFQGPGVSDKTWLVPRLRCVIGSSFYRRPSGKTAWPWWSQRFDATFLRGRHVCSAVPSRRWARTQTLTLTLVDWVD